MVVILSIALDESEEPSISILGSEGKILTVKLTTSVSGDFSLYHLSEHRRMSTPVTVTYQVIANQNIVLDIRD